VITRYVFYSHTVIALSLHYFVMNSIVYAVKTIILSTLLLIDLILYC